MRAGGGLGVGGGGGRGRMTSRCQGARSEDKRRDLCRRRRRRRSQEGWRGDATPELMRQEVRMTNRKNTGSCCRCQTLQEKKKKKKETDKEDNEKGEESFNVASSLSDISTSWLSKYETFGNFFIKRHVTKLMIKVQPQCIMGVCLSPHILDPDWVH